MKASDLMIGDFVFHEKYGNTIIETIDNDFGDNPSIKLISENIKHKDGYKYGYCWCDLDEIFPIPLTPEILEKNGFERCVSSIARTSIAFIPICDSNQFYHKNLGNLRIIDKNPCYGWTLRTDVFGDTCHNEIHHINYVHELQHALKLCGIEKTIEL